MQKPGRCCGTDRTWFGDLRKQERPTHSGQFKISRKVFHLRGEDEYFWHWFDQTKNLAEGYGR